MRHLYALSFLFCALTAHSCWIEVSLTEHVKTKPLIVRGVIVSISEGRADKEALDIASIRVDEILKNETGEIVEVGKTIPLAMPGIHRSVFTSADIRHEMGSTGYWLLDLQEGNYLAAHPKDLQPIESKQELVNALNEKNK